MASPVALNLRLSSKIQVCIGETLRLHVNIARVNECVLGRERTGTEHFGGEQGMWDPSGALDPSIAFAWFGPNSADGLLYRYHTDCFAYHYIASS